MKDWEDFEGLQVVPRAFDVAQSEDPDMNAEISRKMWPFDVTIDDWIEIKSDDRGGDTSQM
jgi:hypothetical protein